MKVAALIVTKDRPAWAEWWAWNILKQDRQPDRIVVVDSSAAMMESVHPSIAAKCNIVPLDNAANTGQARQRCLDEFFKALAYDYESPDDWILMWFDDDDWYHPQRISLMAAAIEEGYPMVAFPPTWTLYLDTMQLYENTEYFEYISLPNAAFMAKYATDAKVNPTAIGEDTHWRCWVQDNVKKYHPPGPHKQVKFLKPAEISAMMIKHNTNVWRRAGHTDFADEFEDAVHPFPRKTYKGTSQEEWDETWRQLEKVRRALGMSQ